MNGRNGEHTIKRTKPLLKNVVVLQNTEQRESFTVQDQKLRHVEK